MLGGLVAIILIGSILVPSLSMFETDKDDLYVFAVFGQSNAAYHYVDLDDVNDNIPAVDPGLAFYFGTDAGPVLYDDNNLADCGIHDMCPSGAWVIGNIEPAFTKKIVDSGKKVLMVNIGVRGASISQLSPAGVYWSYETAVLDAALSKIDRSEYDIIMSGIISIQGEADKYTDVGAYVSEYTKTMDALYRYGFNCTIMTYAREETASNALTAQKEIVATDGSVILGCSATGGFTQENGLLLSDDLHYSQLGDNIIGADCASAWLSSAFIKSYTPVAVDLVAVIPVLLIGSIIATFAYLFLKKTY